MKLIQTLSFLLATTLAPTFGSGVRGVKSRNGVNRRLKGDSKKMTENDDHDKDIFLYLGGMAAASTACFDNVGLCHSFLGLAASLDLGNTTTTSETNATSAYVEALAGIMCGVSRYTNSLSLVVYEGKVRLSVDQKGDDVKAIELYSDLSFLSQSYAYAENIAQAQALASTTAFFYSNATELCNDLVEEDMTEDGVFAEKCANATNSLSEAYTEGASYASAFSSSFSEAWSYGSNGHATIVEGKDIKRFASSVVTGAGSFLSTNAFAASEAITAAYTHSIEVEESFAEICQDFFVSTCTLTTYQDFDYDVAPLCEEDTETVCEQLHILALQYGESFAAVYSESVVAARTVAEVTFGYQLDLDFEEMSPKEFIKIGGSHRLIHASIMDSCASEAHSY